MGLIAWPLGVGLIISSFFTMTKIEKATYNPESDRVLQEWIDEQNAYSQAKYGRDATLFIDQRNLHPFSLLAGTPLILSGMFLLWLPFFYREGSKIWTLNIQHL